MRYDIKKNTPVMLNISVTASREEVDAAMEESQENAREILADKLLSLILEKEQLIPMSHPIYSGGTLEAGREYSFIACFDVLPTIDLPDLSELEIYVPAPELPAEELRKLFTPLLRHFATHESVKEKRLPRNGDIAVVDVCGLLGDQLVPGAQASELHFRLEAMPRGDFELDKLIRDLLPGEEGETPIICPENHPFPAFRNREIRLVVKLRALFKENIPKLDENLARRAGFSTLEELKKKMLAEAMARRLDVIRYEAQARLLQSLLDNTDFPIPQQVQTMFLQEIFMEAGEAMRKQNFSEKQIRAQLNILKPEAKRQAAAQAKAHCFLLALAFRDGLQLTQRDWTCALSGMAREEAPEALASRLREQGRDAEVQDRLLAAQAMDYLYRKARKIIIDRNGKSVRPVT